MSSTRLPGKSLNEINGKPLIYYVLNQVKKSKLINDIILATTNTKKDLALINSVKNLGFKTFAGDENDVLDRFYKAARLFKGDAIVRITGDCPLVDPKVIDKVIKRFIDSKCDYCSNINPPTFPDGLDVEIFSFEALEQAWKEAKLKSEREHVTPYIKNNKHRFKIINVRNKEDISYMRWTVDEKEDVIFIKKILMKLGKKDITLKNILNILNKFSGLKEINAKFKRNEGYAKSIKEDQVVK